MQVTTRLYIDRYDIYLLQLGSFPLQRALHCYTKIKDSNIHKKKQYSSQNTQNGKQKI